MTAQTFLLERIASTGQVFRFWVEVMPEDKRDWIPAIDGTAQTRSVNDMLGELIEVNRMVFNALTGGDAPKQHPMLAPRPFENPSQALPMFDETLAQALSELEKIDASQLEETLEVGVRTMRYLDLYE
ncbi:MAG: hypothetical protein RJB05_1129, partial [Armatimonadota bacterium]